ncbi:S26 family signal peptidase [Streptomyces sp. CAI-85]|uniref:S26 family signal peptidase n=1 Tax=Streptomyces sp. CAI-85 TaxID=1472662 RepID=UPI001587B49E|nr:S26 family signal peptidase [Streptomyces sp. CAI-85]NUV62310.1 S26 family signal peptidase [Streptomyces sp. CAI-85]
MLVLSAVAAGLALVITWASRTTVLITVHGKSMKPTLHSGDHVLVRRGALPKRGQLVVVEQPSQKGEAWPYEPAGLGCRHEPLSNRRWLIKRVAAVAGDPVLPGQLGNRDVTDRCVPEGHFVLLGDNARVSLDSRQIGFFPESRILGKVWRTL